MEEEPPEQGDGGGWLVSYADLMTLLFAAFVVLYGTTPLGETDEKMGFTATIREAFIKIPDVISDVIAKGEPKPGAFVFTAKKGEKRSQPIEKHKPNTDVNAKIRSDFQKIKNFIDKLESDGQGQNQFRNVMTVMEEEKGLRVRLMGAFFFSSGSYDLKPKQKNDLVTIGQFLRKLNRDLIIEGHTDNSRGKGRLSNIDLSNLRSGRIAELFFKEAKISTFSMEAIGYGDSHPIGDNSTLQGRRKNRRIEIKIRYE